MDNEFEKTSDFQKSSKRYDMCLSKVCQFSLEKTKLRFFKYFFLSGNKFETFKLTQIFLILIEPGTY